ncbi:hypothetical protein DL93DRAFT_2090147 [Clavulina sp. PMI_390]|nr:hypothetical protein DL93DRAFT_2090147 [Clavulina sp. PMI_390]
MRLEPISFPQLQFLCVHMPRFLQYIHSPNLLHLRCEDLATDFTATPITFPTLHRLDIASFRQVVMA